MNDQTFPVRVATEMHNPLHPQAWQSEETFDFLEYWRTVTKRKWSILALTLLVGILATFVVLPIRSSYRSTGTILIEQSKSKVVSIEEFYSGAGGNREYFQTQVEILRSDEIARRVIKRLALTSHPDFDPRKPEESAAPFLGQTATPKVAPSEDAINRAVLGRFKGGLQITPVRNSQLVQISYVAFDKEIAAKVPNAVAEVYIDADLEGKVAMSQKASGWLTERMAELRKKLEASERALQDYREANRIVESKGVASSGAGRVLDDATTALASARQKRAEAEGLYNQVQAARQGKTSGGVDALPAVARHPTVAQMKGLEVEAERKFADAGRRYGPEHPRLQQANAELALTRENTKRQIEIVVVGVTKEYELARANEQAIANALAQSKADVQGFNRKEFQLGVLERDVAANRQLVDLFVNRSKETIISSDLQSTVARVIDPATVASGPFAPDKFKMVSTAAGIALLVGMLLALLLDRLSNTINNTASVEKRFGLPVLGVLQMVKSTGKKKGFKSELAFFNDSKSVFAEAVRTIRTSVLLAAVDSPNKVIVVTSSVPEEGKTTVAFNLACALAQIKRVLLIEADLRRPKIGRLLGHASDVAGLTNLVAGTATLQDCMLSDPSTKLSIIAAGIVPPNPLEVLSSNRFKEFVSKFKESFDIVIIDSAPLHLVSDALVLSELADGVIYVVRAESTPYPVAQMGIKRLRQASASIIGVVLNQLDVERAEKYYGEYGAYGHYKGYGYGRGYDRQYGHDATPAK